jgi:hypothetical protein
MAPTIASRQHLTAPAAVAGIAIAAAAAAAAFAPTT